MRSKIRLNRMPLASSVKMAVDRSCHQVLLLFSLVESNHVDSMFSSRIVVVESVVLSESSIGFKFSICC